MKKNVSDQSVLIFKTFKEFCDFFLGKIQDQFPSASIEFLKADFGPAEHVYGSEGEIMVGSSYGEIVFTVKFDSASKEVEFHKECDFEWYFGNPQGPLYAVYNVKDKKLSNFESEAYIVGLFN